METKSKILIVDDHPAFLEGIALILGSIIEDAEYLFAQSGSQAMTLVRKHTNLDWVFIDQHLPDALGVDILQQVIAMKILAPVIIFSAEQDAALLDIAIKNFANGFIAKNASKQEFIDCIQTVEAGHTYLHPNLQKRLDTYRQSLFLEKQTIEKTISNRQRQVLALIAKGCSNGMIAQELALSESTVKTHVSSILSLFHADNRTHCVAEAKRLGIIPQ